MSIIEGEQYIVSGEQLLELARRCDRVVDQSYNVGKSLHTLLVRIHRKGFDIKEMAELCLIQLGAVVAHRDTADSLKNIAFELAANPVDGEANGR